MNQFEMKGIAIVMKKVFEIPDDKTKEIKKFGQVQVSNGENMYKMSVDADYLEEIPLFTQGKAVFEINEDTKKKAYKLKMLGFTAGRK